MISIKFNKDKIYIFSKDKFISAKPENEESYNNDEITMSWVDRIDGKQVEIIHEHKGTIEDRLISPKWCKCPRKNKQER